MKLNGKSRIRIPKERPYRDITIGIARSFEEIESIRELWQEMLSKEVSPKPNVNVDRYISVIKAKNGQAQPLVMLFKKKNEPVAMVIARIEKHQLKLKLGYQALLCPRLRCLSIVYGGILGQPEGKLCSLLVSELMKQLRSRQADIIYFNHLRTDTAFYKAVRTTPGFLTRDHFTRTDEHWYMTVPEKMDQFYLAHSRGHRHNLRRAIRKFDEEYPDTSQFIKYTSKSDVDDFIKIAADISSKTYQGALGVGIVNDDKTKCLLRAAAIHGWFDGNVLFAGDKPCAFQLGLRYEKVYYMVNIGYDPALSSYKIGTILFLRILESLCEDPSISRIDFYFGDAEYKKRYGTNHWPEACPYIFAPRAYPILINALRSSVNGANAGLQHVAKKIGSANWIKRRWRTMLSTTRVNSASDNPT